MTRALWLSLATLLMAATACWHSTTRHDPNEELDVDETYGHTDLKIVTKQLVAKMIAAAPLKTREDRPIVVTIGIRNRTAEHIDTQTMVDKIETMLLDSGKVRIVNREQRLALAEEIDFQEGKDVTSEAKAKLVGAVNAEYIITGNFHQISKSEPKAVRLRKGEVNYYNLVLELTDIKTSLTEWKGEAEIVKEGQTPIIGW